MMIGKGTAKKKIATNDVPAISCRIKLRNVRLPILMTASTTIATTAAWIAEQQPGDPCHGAINRVQDGQSKHRKEPGNDEQDTGDKTSRHAVHQPTDVRRQLLRLWTGQHHAVVQGVKEPALADPSTSLDKFPMHDGDLPCRTTERVDTDERPYGRGVAEG